MLSSIHPLGERARGNRWIVTALWYTAASTAGGAVFGAITATILWPLAHALPASVTMIAVVLCCVAAVAGDLFARRLPPGWHRQVNEDWLVRYRAWLYASGFGFQLGLAVATIITTYAVYAYIAMVALSGSPAAGALIGAVFGFTRAVPVLATGAIHRPQQLRTFHRRLHASAPAVQRVAAAVLLFTAGAVVAAR